MSFMVQRVKDPAPRDLLVTAGYRAANYAKIAQIGLRRGPLQALRDFRKYPWMKSMTQVNDLLDMLTRGRKGRYREANGFVVTNVVSSIRDMVDSTLSAPENTVIHEDLVPPEILYGMGLNAWMAEFLGITLPMIDAGIIEHYIDVAENDGIPPDVCSLPKSTIGMALDRSHASAAGRCHLEHAL